MSTSQDSQLMRVVAAVIRRRGRYLLARRPEHKHHGGLWEFPGGKCEPGESDLEALERELAEELGVRMLAASPIVQLTDALAADRTIVLAFLEAAVEGEPECIEHTELAWHALFEMPRLQLAPVDARFVKECLPRLATQSD